MEWDQREGQEVPLLLTLASSWGLGDALFHLNYQLFKIFSNNALFFRKSAMKMKETVLQAIWLQTFTAQLKIRANDKFRPS